MRLFVVACCYVLLCCVLVRRLMVLACDVGVVYVWLFPLCLVCVSLLFFVCVEMSCCCLLVSDFRRCCRLRVASLSAGVHCCVLVVVFLVCR